MLQPDDAVHQAVRSFVPPCGYVAFPMPTKNNAQRSLIYVYGRRVQSTTDTRKSKWFCLASPQCRANGTTISTSANISGCTRHLHVFHDLVSPKTVQMNRKCEGVKLLLPDDQLEPAHQDQNQRSEDATTREHTLEWTICFAVRQLLPIAPLVQDQRLEKLLNLPSGFDEQRVRHHIVEIYASTIGPMKQMIQRELSKAQTPLLHLSLGPVFAHEEAHAPMQLALAASFVSSEFELKRVVLGVTQIGSNDSTKDLQTAFASWSLRVLRTFGIHRAKHIRSCTIHSSLGQHTLMVKTALETSVGLACTFSCVDRCLYALNGTYTAYDGGCLKRLVISLGGFAGAVGHSKLGTSRFQHLKTGLELVALGSQSPQQFYQLTEPEHTDDGGKMDETRSWNCSQYWSAVGSILSLIVEVWTELEMFFFSDSDSVAPDLLRAFNKSDLVQVLSILQPIIQFMEDMEQAEYPAAPEALVRMIAIKHSTLNVEQPLQLIPGVMRSEDDPDMEVAIPSTEMTIFGRSLRQELAERWNQSTENMLSPSMSDFAMCAFFHPCFRRLGLLERGDVRKTTSQLSEDGEFGEGQLDKSQLTAKIKRLARDIFRSKSTPLSSPACESEEENGLSDLIPTQSAKKRRKTQLNRQAEELRRLGILEETNITNPNGLQDHTPPLSEWVLSQEFDRYVKHESVAFGDVPFDRILSYWQQKTLEYPTIALVAQSALGHPVSADGSRIGHGESSMKMAQIAGHGRFFSELQCSDALTTEEMTLILHFNQAYILPAVATLTDEQVARYTASCMDNQP